MNPKHLAVILLLSMAIIICGCQQRVSIESANGVLSVDKIGHEDVKRVGMVIKIKPERLDEYLAVHADSVSGVRDLLEKYNMRNFSIFMVQLEDSNYYEFGYWEYWGNDFEADMANLDAEPRNQEWLQMCGPMQNPLEGETSWKELDQIYFNYQS